MKIKIYLRDNILWVETEGISNPDGCTGIDTERPLICQANGLFKLLKDVITLPKDEQDNLHIQIIELNHETNQSSTETN